MLFKVLITSLLTEEVQRLVERSTVGSELQCKVQRNQRTAQVAVA